MGKGAYVFILLGIFAFSAPANAGNWPGWRGDGSGVSQESDLPVQWGPDENVVWKTRIKGSGISSPIIWNDRVFVTTAIEGMNSKSDETVGAIGVALFVIAAISILLGGRSRREGSAGDAFPKWLRFLHAVDRTAVAIVFLSFCAGVVGLLYYRDQLLYMGRVSRTWVASGICAMLGLVAAVGCFSRASKTRILGSFVLVVAGVLFYRMAPLNMFNKPIPLKLLLPTTGPLIIAAAWFMFLAIATNRLSSSPRPLKRSGLIPNTISSLALTACAATVFVFLNYFSETTLKRTIVCLDRETGRVLWQTSGFEWPADKKYFSNSYATPTPATDGTYVAAGFGPGLFCVDFDGNVKWVKMEPQYGICLRYGAAISPVVFSNNVIHTYIPEFMEDGPDQFAIEEHAYIESRRLDTGDLVWKTHPPGGHDTYDSPLLVDNGVHRALVMMTWNHAIALDPADGGIMWKCSVPIQQSVGSAVADDRRVYVAGGTHMEKGAAAVRLGGSGDVTDTHVDWTLSKRIPECASPVLYEGLIYWITEKGILSCIDASTGDELWKDRIDGHYVGSLVAGDGKVYIPSDDGDVTVIEAGREFKQLARNSIGEESGSSPAIAGQQIFIRGKDHLFCIGRALPHDDDASLRDEPSL